MIPAPHGWGALFLRKTYNLARVYNCVQRVTNGEVTASVI
jgi:hypothetical protein